MKRLYPIVVMDPTSRLAKSGLPFNAQVPNVASGAPKSNTLGCLFYLKFLTYR
jgi:hypothetical protein